MDKPILKEDATLTIKAEEPLESSGADFAREENGWSRLLSTTQWENIKRAGRIEDDHFKLKIIRAIEIYKRQRTATKTTRDRVEQVRSVTFKLSRLLEELSENDEFLYVGTGVNGEDVPNIGAFAAIHEHIIEIYELMDKADSRFDRAPRQLIFPSFGALEDFVFAVLMTQAHALGKAPPTYHQESSANPKFEEFVYLCAQAADPELSADSAEARKKIERALFNATQSFMKVRDMDRAGWAANWNLDWPSRK